MSSRKGSGCLTKILVFILIVVILLVGGYLVLKYFQDSNAKQAFSKSEDLLMESVVIDQYWDYTAETLPESEYGKDFDNDGLTNGEEIKAGTNFYSNDTDRDGISDFTEINKYKSNPLKISTAGDGISDLVKAAKGMDFNEPADKTSGVSSKIEINRGISLKPDDISSEFLYIYEKYTGDVFKDIKTLAEPFVIYDFEGKIALEKDQIPDGSNSGVYYYDTVAKRLVKEKDIKNTGEGLEFTCRAGYPTAIAASADDMAFAAGILGDGGEKAKEYYFILVPFTLYNPNDIPDIGIGDYNIRSFIKLRDTVFVLEIDDLKGVSQFNGDTGLESKIGLLSSGWDSDHYYFPSVLMNIALNTYQKYAVSEDENIRRTVETIIIKHLNCTDSTLINEITAFMLENGYSVKGMGTGEYDADSGFKVTVNGFPFSNLSTSVGKNGVCAGFAHVARQTYNGYPLPLSAGSYSFGDYFAPGYSIDEPVYDVIKNGLLRSYEPLSTALKAKSDELYDEYDRGIMITASTLGKPDDNVVNLLDYYWLFDNGERINSEARSNLNRYDYNFDIIKEISNEFKTGRVVEVNVFGGIGGHAVVGYNLYQDRIDPNVFRMNIYDSNFPDNKRFVYSNAGSAVRMSTDVAMNIRKYPKRVISNDGSVDTGYFFSFDYRVASDRYRWNNMYGGDGSVSFYKTGSNAPSEIVDGK